MNSPAQPIRLPTRHLVPLFLALTAALAPAKAQNTSNATVAASVSNTATPAATASTSAVPPLVRFSGVAKEPNGAAISATVGVTFLIYSAQEGGSPLWLETQNVQPDSIGQYSVLLGATKAEGLPADLFASGQARWLAVQISSQPEQPRVLLLSVPYAMKAADADTVGGLPASAFLLATPSNAATLSSGSSSASAAPPQAAASGVTPDAGVLTGAGAANYLPLWTTSSNLGNSSLFQASNGFIGINTTTPAAGLDVAGNVQVEGGLTFPPEGTATATTDFASHSFYFIASAYNSTTKTATDQTFAFAASPLNNNTASPAGVLKLRFAEGTGSTQPTGFEINSNGLVNFAAGQTFPGTSTITDVAAGTGLTGGGTTGTATLNVDSTKVPLLASANTFNATQTITNGNLVLPATASSTAGVLYLGGTPFLHGYNGGNNVFIGGAGNFSNFASGNVAAGVLSLTALTSGNDNVALGENAMFYGSSTITDTAVGYSALEFDRTGYNNTAVGSQSGVPSTSTSLMNTTALGASATVNQNNSLVLGNTTTNPGAQFVNVGIGTATPLSILEADASATSALGPAITLINPGGGQGAATAVDFNSYYPSLSGKYNPAARIEAVDANNYSDDIVFLSNIPASTPVRNNGLQTNMVISSIGNVGIGTSAPATFSSQLTVLATVGQTGVQVVGGDVNGCFVFCDGMGIEATGGAGSASFPGGTGGTFNGGKNTATGGDAGDGIYASVGDPGSTMSGGMTAAYAGIFEGDVSIIGTLSANLKNFKIDHPLDPANKYLVHASVESSEMMDIYTGNVVTDAKGLATVTLPTWFQSLNTDFRYQLTVIGQFAQAIVSKEITDNQFVINSSVPGVKVSWQVTAVRQDAYAKAHPLVAEEAKPANERGYYLNPELFGQPRQKQAEWGRRPQQMRQMEAQRELAEKARESRLSAKTATTAASVPASAVNRTFTHPQIPVTRPGTVAKPASTAAAPAKSATPTKP